MKVDPLQHFVAAELMKVAHWPYAEKEAFKSGLLEGLKIAEQLTRPEEKDSKGGTNYVCDHDAFPQKITFSNGRVVKMIGQGHLFVGWEDGHS